MDDNTIYLGLGGDQPQLLHLSRANRHGLIAGATGTGKTVSLQVLAEGFSRAGVPVFMADVKGDLSGMAMAGKRNTKLDARASRIGMEALEHRAYPVTFWDLYGKKGHPVRTTVSEMGPLLLARLMELNDTQSGVLEIAFAVADDNDLLLLDWKDLRAMLTFIADNAKDLQMRYGNVSRQSVGAIQRRLLGLERAGAGDFFGEPALEVIDLMRRTRDGEGVINILAADKLMRSPRLYATFLLWLLSELFETLPEQGDSDRPELVFFFDEAHLLFKDAPPALVETVEQVVRLIRSKGVGVYFVTQSPSDLPDAVLAQLGNRVQHALRAFTPRDRRAVRAAADSFRSNPAFDAAEVIGELGVGEALVSTLGPRGAPSPVERTLIRPPESRLGPLTRAERSAVMDESRIGHRYVEPVDRESAFELLAERAAKSAEEAAGSRSRTRRYQGQSNAEGDAAPAPRRRSGGRQRQTMVEAMAKSALRSVGSQIGRSIGKSLMRGLLGSFFKGR